MAFRIQKPPPALTDGTYPGLLTDAQTTPSKFNKNTNQIKWVVEIIHDGRIYTAQAYTDDTFYQHSRERKWLESIIGQTLQEDDEIDEKEALIDKPVMVTIRKNVSDLGVTFYNITHITGPKASDDAEAGMVGTPINTEDEVPF